MPKKRLRIGTRSSRLARVQVDLAVRALCKRQPELAHAIEIIEIDSAGDRNRREALEDLGGRGIFTDDVDRALVDDRIDVAVHSVKDLPAVTPDCLALAATLEREDPREALVSPFFDCLEDLPQGVLIGSASHRRMAFLKLLRPDVKFALLRGNVEERVAALKRRQLGGTILAVAGLKRLGLHRHIKQIFDPEDFPPDPGQGAIGLVCRSDDARVRRLLSPVNHLPTFACVAAERSFLRVLDSKGCIPAGALGQVTQDQSLSLSAALVSDDGRTVIRATSCERTGSAEHIGAVVAQDLLNAMQWERAA